MKSHAPLGLGLASALAASLIVAACGGAIDNSELYKKDQSGTSSSGGSGTTPAPTATVTSVPTPGFPPPPPKPDRCKTSFQKDVVGVLIRNGCTNASCHGGTTPLNAPRIDENDPPSTYKELLSFTMSDGKRYVVQSTNPKASGMFCNLRAACGVPMPISDKVSSSDLDVVDQWLACGAPLN